MTPPRVGRLSVSLRKLCVVADPPLRSAARQFVSILRGQLALRPVAIKTSATRASCKVRV